MSQSDKEETERKAAQNRIYNEICTGTILKSPDGTTIVGGELVKIGPRAIVVNGELVGMRPE